MISSVLNYYEVQRLCFYATAKKIQLRFEIGAFLLYFLLAFLRLTDRLCIK